MIPSSQKFNLIFTSPPFFDFESYTKESNQSIEKYDLGLKEKYGVDAIPYGVTMGGWKDRQASPPTVVLGAAGESPAEVPVTPVVDPAPIIGSVERLSRKGGREVVARCPSEQDADDASQWLLDRLSRLVPKQKFETSVESGGGQFLLVLRA